MELQLWRMALLVALVSKPGQAGQPPVGLPEIGSDGYQSLERKLEHTSNKLADTTSRRHALDVQEREQMVAELAELQKQLSASRAEMGRRDLQYAQIQVASETSLRVF